MRTIDARLLVRGSHEPDEALEQLLTGVLRVHAAVELRPNADDVLVATPPVHRHRDAVHYDVVRRWTGRSVVADVEVRRPSRIARVRSLCDEALGSTAIDGVELARAVLAALDGES